MQSYMALFSLQGTPVVKYGHFKYRSSRGQYEGQKVEQLEYDDPVIQENICNMSQHMYAKFRLISPVDMTTCKCQRMEWEISEKCQRQQKLDI